MKKTIQIKKMILSAMFLALGWLFPIITGNIPSIGSMLCPMHIPVILAGFILGPYYGLVLGFITPITRSLMIGMPPMYPTAISMAFELAIYGLLSGLLYRLFKDKLKDIVNIYVSLIIAMLGGRLVWGLVRYVMLIIPFLPASQFSFSLFLSGAFVTAWPGIILQLILIPAIMYALNKAKLIEDFFNTLASSWDEEENHTKEEKQFLLKQLDLKDNDYVLDIGCGTGVITGLIHEFTNGKVLGIDIADKMIEIAKNKYQDYSWANFKCIDIMNFNSDIKFDKAIIYNAYPHFIDPKALSKKIASLLKENGKFAILHSLSSKELNLHHSGIANVVSRDLLSVDEEEKNFLNEFNILKKEEGQHYYFIIGQKK